MRTGAHRHQPRDQRGQQGGECRCASSHSVGHPSSDELLQGADDAIQERIEEREGRVGGICFSFPPF